MPHDHKQPLLPSWKRISQKNTLYIMILWQLWAACMSSEILWPLTIVLSTGFPPTLAFVGMSLLIA